MAGLPSEKGIFGYTGGNYNSGGFIAEGTILNTEGLSVRSALSLHGHTGGIEELVFRDPINQIRIDKVYGVNPCDVTPVN